MQIKKAASNQLPATGERNSALGIQGFTRRASDRSPTASDTRIFLIDSHPLMLAGLRVSLMSAVGLFVAAETSSFAMAQRLLKQLDIQVVILDAMLDDIEASDAVAALKQQSPALRVLVSYMSLTQFEISQLIKAGVDGLILRNACADDFIQAIRTIMRGASFIPIAVTSRIFTDSKAPATPSAGGMTARETDVLRLIASGFSNKDIARRLQLSIRTVETHRLNLRKKTGMLRPKDMVLFAHRLGLLSLPEDNLRRPDSRNLTLKPIGAV